MLGILRWDSLQCQTTVPDPFDILKLLYDADTKHTRMLMSTMFRYVYAMWTSLIFQEGPLVFE